MLSYTVNKFGGKEELDDAQGNATEDDALATKAIVTLNLSIEVEKQGIWKKYGVQTIGVDIKGIETAEDREAFRLLMQHDRDNYLA